MAFRFSATTGKLKPPPPEQLAAADANGEYILVLDRGTVADGAPYWAYIAVTPSKYAAFMEAARTGTPRALKDYGAILKFGFDAEVPTAIQQLMREEHGFDEHYLARLTEKLKKLQAAAFKQKEAKRLDDIVAMLKKQAVN